ncbi:cardiolipin synthase [Haloferula sp.]|uniref:cardiolipin synthase n=1 Tax=Haloferula sp. TaxID=2497595 RepID=UPI003C73B4CE
MKTLFDFFTHPSTLAIILHLLLVIGFSIRVVMQRPATGVALAWLFLIAAIPFGGAFAYLLVGEKRIGKERVKRLARLRDSYEHVTNSLVSRHLTEVDWSEHPPEAREMDRLGSKMIGLPTVCGTSGKLFSDTGEILKAIAEDVRNAERSVLMEFYIWNEGGLADEVLEAVIGAAERGLDCRLLIDGLGAAPWWKGDQPSRLRDAGVKLKQALPAGFIRMLVGRNDVRLHRKIVIIDGMTAWTGSMNMVDPRFFKQDANVGEWVDAMVRVKGGVVAPLALTMIGDWTLETGEDVFEVAKAVGFGEVESNGSAAAQVVPSGPGQTEDGLLQMLLATVNSAREELVLTTPYFVPDDSLLRAIRGAAARGVAVSMIVPEKVDSLLTRYASRSFYDELIDSGVKIFLYRKGLLHTKSITADRRISMFGTVNLDMRSLWINYEVAAFVYGTVFGDELRQLQQSYMEDSEMLDGGEWAKRSKVQKFLESAFRLSAPML